MSGGSEPHSFLSGNAIFTLRSVFRSCRVYDSNLRLYIPQVDRCVYPDAMMPCGEPLFHDEQEDVILNPQGIVEVLSPSTKRYDQQTKSGFYRSIPSITDILLIAQDAFHIEHFTRKTDGAWVITPFNKPDDKLTILERTLNLSTFYEGFDLQLRARAFLIAQRKAIAVTLNLAPSQSFRRAFVTIC